MTPDSFRPTQPQLYRSMGNISNKADYTQSCLNNSVAIVAHRHDGGSRNFGIFYPRF
jgi:hypothetical protein